MQIGKNDTQPLCHESHYFQLTTLPIWPAWQTLFDCPLMAELWKIVFFGKVVQPRFSPYPASLIGTKMFKYFALLISQSQDGCGNA